MGHVRDMDLELEISVLEAADQDGVVEIAGGFAVDSDDGQVTVVAALVQFARLNDSFDLLGFFQHLCRKAVRQVKLTDHDLDIDAEIVLVAENFDDAASGILRGRGSVISTSTTAFSKSSHEARRAASSPRTRCTDFFFFVVFRSPVSPGVSLSGYSMPGGIMISCEIFSSMGVT